MVAVRRRAAVSTKRPGTVARTAAPGLRSLIAPREGGAAPAGWAGAFVASQERQNKSSPTCTCRPGVIETFFTANGSASSTCRKKSAK